MSAAERQRGKDRRDGKSKRIGEKHAMTQCINMHKRAKTSINVEVLVNDKACVPHETRTQRNALPCTACGNRGSRKSRDGVSNGSSAAKAAADMAEGARKGREKRAEAECRRIAERRSVRGRQANGFVGRRAGKGEVLLYIEPDDEFCLPQDRSKRNRKSRKCDGKQRRVII